MAQKEKEVIEFSSGDSQVKLNLFEFSKELIKTLPDIVKEEEIANKKNAGKTTSNIEFQGMNVNEDSMAIHERAVEIQKAEKCSYEIAVNKAVNEQRAAAV